MSNRKVLIIEDDEHKKKSVVSLLQENFHCTVDFSIAESLSSAIRALSAENIDLAIVDMSIPAFDVGKDRHGGGQPQGFGGADILRFIESETSSTRSVVLTQYSEFYIDKGEVKKDIKGLESDLQAELGERFLGVIHYSGQHGPWREKLIEILKKFLKDKI